jgi:hypothetical protein
MNLVIHGVLGSSRYRFQPSGSAVGFCGSLFGSGMKG